MKKFLKARFCPKKGNKILKTLFIRLFPVYTILTNARATQLSLYISTTYQQEFFQLSLDKNFIT